MLRNHTDQHKTKPATLYPGICAAAREIGCTRMHLYHCLRGGRRSPSVEKSEYYKKIMASQQEAKKGQE